MRWWRNRRVVIRVSTAGLGALVCALAAASCAGGAVSGGAPALQQGDFGLPHPSDLPRNPSFIDANRTMLGSNYTHIGSASPDHVSAEATKLRFSPVWNPAGPHSIVDAARAGFNFMLTDYDDEPTVELNWATPPTVPGNLWIAAANWGANRWDWRQYTGGPVNLGSIAPYLSATKGIFVALVLLGTDEALLESVRIGPTLWQITVVDTGGAGMYDSLALDSSGEPHISYAGWDGTKNDLKYAYRSGATWNVETLDSLNDVGKYTSLALDSADHPHISYFDATNKLLMYATNAGAGWTAYTPNPGNDAGYYSSIALDSLGQPRIAYFNASFMAVCYVAKNGIVWDPMLVDPQGVNDRISLAIDAADIPHVGYTSTTGVRQAWYSSSTWWVDPLSGVSSGALWGSRVLTFGPSDAVHLLFYDTASTKAYLGLYRYGVWSWSELPFGADTGQNASLATDSSGLPYISYFTTPGMEYARFDGSAWHRTTVDSGWEGWDTSLVLDANGKPCISYFDPGNQELRYAEYVN